jgi:hypothetical protein
MLKKLVIKSVKKLAQIGQPKKHTVICRKTKKQEKKNYKNGMIESFGAWRWYLSYWFGPWVLAAWNHRDYSRANEKPYEKWYADEKVAQRYQKALSEEWKYTEIRPLFDGKGSTRGFLLIGKVNDKMKLEH